jgi:hypothetical protein
LWYKVKVKDLERALLDIAEVRERLAVTQTFKGYSGAAAAFSGILALIAGGVQAKIVPAPSDAHGMRIYFAIWLVCCAASVIVNYGAIAHWFASDVSIRDRWQTRTVGLSILPALVVGGALSFALIRAEQGALLPGLWYCCYGAGLFASRTMIPRAVVPMAAIFLLAGIGLLFAPPEIALAWWVMPLGFGAMQLAIGYFVQKDRKA